VSVRARSTSADRAAADLLERLALVEGVGPAATLVLERALALTGLERRRMARTRRWPSC
jgi:hypothetical protein